MLLYLALTTLLALTVPVVQAVPADPSPIDPNPTDTIPMYLVPIDPNPYPTDPSPTTISHNRVNAGTHVDVMLSGRVGDKDYYLCLNANNDDQAIAPTEGFDYVLMETPQDNCRITTSTTYKGVQTGQTVDALLPHRGETGHYFFSFYPNSTLLAAYSGLLDYPKIDVQEWKINHWQDYPGSVYDTGTLWNWKFNVVETSGDPNDQILSFYLGMPITPKDHVSVIISVDPLTGLVNTTTDPHHGGPLSPSLVASFNPKNSTVWTLKNYAA